MNIEAVMTREPKTCSTTDTLHRAAQLMWDADCGAVPVVDEAGRLAGWITDRDVCMASYTRGRAPHEIAVADVMSRTLFTLAARDGVDAALVLFADRLVRRAPVVDDDGKVVGIVSIADLVEAAVDGANAKHVSKERVLNVVHAVSKPSKTKSKPDAARANSASSTSADTLVPAGSAKKKSNGAARSSAKSKRA